MPRPASRGRPHTSKRHVQIVDEGCGSAVDDNNSGTYVLPEYVEELLAEIDRPLETFEQELYEPTAKISGVGNARASIAGALIASIQNETDSSRLPGLALLGLGLGLSPEVLFQGAAPLPVPVEPPALVREATVAPPEHDEDEQEQQEEEEEEERPEHAALRPIFRVRTGCNIPPPRHDMAPAGFVPAALWGPPPDPSRQPSSVPIGTPPAIQVKAVKSLQQQRPDTLTSVLLLHQKAGRGLSGLPNRKVRGSILAWRAAQRQVKSAGAGKAASPSDLANKEGMSKLGGTRPRTSAGETERQEAGISVAIWGGDAFANEGYSGYGPAHSSHSHDSSDGFRSQASRRLHSKQPFRDNDMPMLAKVSAETQAHSSSDAQSYVASPTSSAPSSPRGSFRRFGGTGLSPMALKDGPDVSPLKPPLTETGSPRGRRIPCQAKLHTLPAWLHAAHEELEGLTADPPEARICGSQGFRVGMSGMVVRSSTAPQARRRPSTG